MFETPVIYIFFNRPSVTRRTFAAVRAQRPAKLYLIADGPRANRPADLERCRETKAVVESMLDWDCEVTRDYSEINLGAGQRIATGLTAAFAQFGEAIVLEDDILPHPDFFRFCAETLTLYRDDPSVHGISGFNPVGRFLPHQGRCISTLTHITWGWASWSRAWANYRGELQGWSDPAVRAKIRAYVNNDLYFEGLSVALQAVADRRVDAWDYQWVFTMLYEQRRAVVSSVNLITNLGFMSDATHTFDAPPYVTELSTYALPKSPWPKDLISTDRLFDRVATQILGEKNLWKITVLRTLSCWSRWLTGLVLRESK
jgi:hypothetical protein